MIQKITLLFAACFLTGCSFSSSLQGNLFSEVWEDHAEEPLTSRTASFSQRDFKYQFSTWAQEFEKKRESFVRIEENGVKKNTLEGSAIISGENLSRNIEQYKIALEKLKTVTAEQNDVNQLIRQVCIKQKTSVSCGL